MPYIKTPSGINWFYDARGEGKVLVFIHGWSFDSGVWFRQVDDFSGYKVVIIDLPGQGNSSYKEKIDIAEELNFIFDELRLNNINLIGHSLGGFIALKFVLTYPTLVNRLILVGTNARFVKSGDYEYGLSEYDVEKLRGFLKGDYPEILLVFMRRLFTNQERSQSYFREIWDSIAKRKTWPKKETLSGFLSVIEKEDLRTELNKINLPTLVISGTKDPICPVESANYISKDIKDSKVVLFPGCGHLPFLTQPEKFNKLVKEFLQS